MNNVYLVLFGTLLSVLAIFVASTGGIWMSFTYFAFIISNAYTSFTVYERIQKDLPDDKESVCTVNDEQTIEKGAMTATTTTNTSNMIGRAAVGGLLLGGTGAIIGGATAKKNTVINQENDVINHHYIVTISVKDLGAPYITIRTDNIDTANQILSLVNAVIASK